MDFVDVPVHGIGVRHVQVALVFSMVVVMYAISMAPPVGIVAMTDPSTSPNPDVPSYPEWNDQSLILTSFYWGFAPTQLLGGPLSRKYGTKWFMVVSMIIASLISLWIPALIMKFGSVALMLCFFMQGLCQGIIVPMLSDFISKWAPVPERTTIGTFIFASKTLGTVFATETTGLLSSSWWGWPSTFYLYGSLGIIWSIVMIVLGCDDPDEHLNISQLELDYIKGGKHLTKKKVPWCEILKSVPTWATWIGHIGMVWTIRLTSTEMPTYLNRVLGFSVKDSSTVLSVTYLVAYLNCLVISSLSQYFINKNYLTTGTCRKLCNSIASWGSACLLVLLAIFRMERYIGLVIIFFIFVCTNTSFAGFNINYNDLSPNYSGCLFGVGGVTATIISFAPTTLVQFMVTNQSNSLQWGHAFYLAALVTSLGNLFFVLKGSGDVQDWDDVETHEGTTRQIIKFLLEKFRYFK